MLPVMRRSLFGIPFGRSAEVTLDAFNTVFLTVAFVVPGFLLHGTLSLATPERDRPVQLLMVRFLTLSCVNYAFCSWLVYLIGNARPFVTSPLLTALAWAAIILVSPIMIGLLSALLRQKEWVRRALQSCGLRPLHPVPSSWDYVFGSVTDCLWVMVTLKNGSSVAGLFGTGSFASSEPGERDLYLERVLNVGASGAWTPVERSAGILLRGEDIRYVEFWTDEEAENAGQQTTGAS